MIDSLTPTGFPTVSDISNAELLSAIDRHMAASVETTLKAGPHEEWRSGPGYCRYFTGKNHFLGNIVWNARLDESDLSTAVADALRPMKEAGLPGAWVVGPNSSPNGLADALVANGMVLGEKLPAMACNLDGIAEMEIPDGVSIETVSSDEENEKWVQTLSAGYELPLDIAGSFSLREEHFRQGDSRRLFAYLCCKNGVPAACSMLFLHDGFAGVYSVATLPVYRKQGLGKLVTLHALHAAKSLGYRIGILQASKMGLPIYQKLGFRECGHLSFYVLHPPSDDAVAASD